MQNEKVLGVPGHLAAIAANSMALFRSLVGKRMTLWAY